MTCNTSIVIPDLSSSSSGSSSISRTLLKQENHSFSFSSSSRASPTICEVSVRRREDTPNKDISPVPVPELDDDRSGRRDETQANETPKNNKKETQANEIPKEGNDDGTGNPCGDFEILE